MNYCKFAVRPSPYQYDSNDSVKNYITQSGKKIEQKSPALINDKSVFSTNVVNTKYNGYDQIFVVNRK